jgi:hypothetical protein
MRQAPYGTDLTLLLLLETAFRSALDSRLNAAWMLPACPINASNGIWPEKTNRVRIAPSIDHQKAHLEDVTSRVLNSETGQEKFMVEA